MLHFKCITNGNTNFRALAEIKAEKLYTIEYHTFEAYCKERWGWQKAHAYRLIEAANVVKTSPVGDKITTERQAREVAKVEPAKRAQVIEVASAKAEINIVSPPGTPASPRKVSHIDPGGSDAF